jgi:hypothetical protein
MTLALKPPDELGANAVQFHNPGFCFDIYAMQPSGGS